LRRPVRFAAYGVHVFTATGSVLAILALAATLDGRLDRAFLFLGLALIVDGVDGLFARKLRVTETAPLIDGELLDLVVDYTTYVFVPAVMLLSGRFLPEPFTLPATALMVLTAALYFADTRMKTADAAFRGFPAAWNVVLFYFAVFRPDPWLALAVVVLAAAAQFAPVRFVHPMRVRRLRVVTLGVLALWTAAAVAVVLSWAAPPVWAKPVLLAGGLWFLLAGAFTALRR
jgi:phosphatidylcholine synthase